MEQRTRFRDLRNSALNIRLPTDAELQARLAGPGDVVLVAVGSRRSRIVAIISQDHLFDADGNRFAY